MLKIIAEFNPNSRETEYVGYITNIRTSDNSPIFVTGLTVEQVIYKLCNRTSNQLLKIRNRSGEYIEDYECGTIEHLNDLNFLIENSYK